MSPETPHPMWLLFELTYRCPLQCPYCSNPTEYANYKNELSTEQWINVLDQGRDIGCVQLGFSGGEPLVRQDLEDLIKHAHGIGYYTNLITSTVGMDENRLSNLKDAGLDHIQISFQASQKDLNDFIAGTKSFEHKLEMARAVKAMGFPIVFNMVIHRFNIDYMQEILDFAIDLGADFVELANTQYLGFAFENKELLLPTRKQLQKSEQIANEYKQKYNDKTKILYVVPDLYEKRPKPCMDGWGRVFITVTPDGFVLPCQSARVLPGIEFPNVVDKDLKWIWYESEAFNHYRGEDWMKLPCKTCPERGKDYGGCHCQAYLFTGDQYTADPVCDLTDKHTIIEDLLERAQKSQPIKEDLIFRNPKSSKSISIKTKDSDK